MFDPVTKCIKDVFGEETKTMTENSIKNNQAIENLNNKLLEIMNDRGMLASYLMSPLFKINNPEISSQFKLIKGSNSNRVNNLLIHNTIPITLHHNLLTVRDTNKVIELKGDLSKMKTNNYNVDHASLADKKIIVRFCKRIEFRYKSSR